jgi:hypothetical protein
MQGNLQSLSNDSEPFSLGISFITKGEALLSLPSALVTKGESRAPEQKALLLTALVTKGESRAPEQKALLLTAVPHPLYAFST